MGAVGSSATGQAYIEFKLDTTNWATFKRRWNLLASQIECDRNYHAPQVKLSGVPEKCLTFEKGTSLERRFFLGFLTMAMRTRDHCQFLLGLQLSCSHTRPN